MSRRLVWRFLGGLEGLGWFKASTCREARGLDGLDHAPTSQVNMCKGRGVPDESGTKIDFSALYIEIKNTEYGLPCCILSNLVS